MSFDRAVILAGKPAREKALQPGFNSSRANTLGYLADTMASSGTRVSSPPIYHSYDPSFRRYMEEFLVVEACMGLNWEESSVIVAPSAAAGPALEWSGNCLRNEIFVSQTRLLVIAPWFDLNGRYKDMRLPSLGRLAENLGKAHDLVTVVHSGEDDDEATESLEWLREKVPGLPEVVIEGAGHFVTGNKLEPDYPLGNGLYGSTCPAILDVIKRL